MTTMSCSSVDHPEGKRVTLEILRLITRAYIVPKRYAQGFSLW